MSDFTVALHDALSRTIAPDTQVIKAATVELNTKFYVNMQAVPSLFEIASTSSEQAVSLSLYYL